MPMDSAPVAAPVLNPIAQALRRVREVLLKRPSAGLHDDATATARWQGGTRVSASHASGASMETDMPAEVGGSGDRVSPGWMFRAGLASCCATLIAMTAAEQGIALSALEVKASSRSDSRGFLGMREPDGRMVYPGPQDLTLSVKISAPGVPAAKLRQLVQDCQPLAPIGAAVRDAQDVRLLVEVG